MASSGAGERRRSSPRAKPRGLFVIAHESPRSPRKPEPRSPQLPERRGSYDSVNVSPAVTPTESQSSLHLPRQLVPGLQPAPTLSHGGRSSGGESPPDAGAHTGTSSSPRRGPRPLSQPDSPNRPVREGARRLSSPAAAVAGGSGGTSPPPPRSQQQQQQQHSPRRREAPRGLTSAAVSPPLPSQQQPQQEQQQKRERRQEQDEGSAPRPADRPRAVGDRPVTPGTGASPRPQPRPLTEHKSTTFQFSTLASTLGFGGAESGRDDDDGDRAAGAAAAERPSHGRDAPRQLPPPPPVMTEPRIVHVFRPRRDEYRRSPARHHRHGRYGHGHAHGRGHRRHGSRHRDRHGGDGGHRHHSRHRHHQRRRSMSGDSISSRSSLSWSPESYSSRGDVPRYGSSKHDTQRRWGGERAPPQRFSASVFEPSLMTFEDAARQAEEAVEEYCTAMATLSVSSPRPQTPPEHDYDDGGLGGGGGEWLVPSFLATKPPTQPLDDDDGNGEDPDETAAMRDANRRLEEALGLGSPHKATQTLGALAREARREWADRDAPPVRQRRRGTDTVSRLLQRSERAFRRWERTLGSPTKKKKKAKKSRSLSRALKTKKKKQQKTRRTHTAAAPAVGLREQAFRQPQRGKARPSKKTSRQRVVQQSSAYLDALKLLRTMREEERNGGVGVAQPAPQRRHEQQPQPAAANFSLHIPGTNADLNVSVSPRGRAGGHGGAADRSAVLEIHSPTASPRAAPILLVDRDGRVRSATSPWLDDEWDHTSNR